MGGSPVYKWYTGKDNNCIFLRPIGSQQLLRVGYGPRTRPAHAWLVTGLGVCRSSAGWAGAMKKASGCPSPQLLALAVFSPTPLFNDFLLLNKTQGNTIKNNFSFLNLFDMINFVCAMHACRNQRTTVQASSVFPPHGSQGWNLGQAWHKDPSLLSHLAGPKTQFLKPNILNTIQSYTD